MPFEVYWRFVGRTRGSSSSSSPLDVRSMTWCVLFPLTVLDSLDMPDEDGACEGCPLVGIFGVPILILSPDFVISTRSSSESLANPFDRKVD